MNAISPMDRQAVELARYEAMLHALQLAEAKMKRGEFYESYEGLDAVRAINDWLRGEEPQAVIDVIAGNLPDTTAEEDSDPYHGGGCFPAMREHLLETRGPIAPFARALGGR